MCGVLGVVTAVGRGLSVDESTIIKMRDRMKHRGPDGEGLWMNHHVAFAHRRLSILDLEHGQQPFQLGNTDSPEQQELIYNGEIYNHLVLRKELQNLGVQFETKSDTETLAKAWATWGEDALPKLRGMFAFAVYERKHQRVTIVRDAMGIKPLYYGLAHTPQGVEVVFASEPLAVVSHPSMTVQPDWVTVSSYLTTIRTTLGHRSMYEGVNVLQPGELIEIDLSGDLPKLNSRYWYQGQSNSKVMTLEEAIYKTQATITDSIDSHLIGDVESACLLSGGLDSTIVTSVAMDSTPNLRTWCSGAIPTDANNVEDSDIEHAIKVAEAFGTQHETVPVNHRSFNETWLWMIRQTGLPLSTPNQISIYQVTKSLGKHAKIAISGEGADEIFAGYDAQLRPFANYLRGVQNGGKAGQTPLDFYLQMTSWVPLQIKGSILNPVVMEEANQDYVLIKELQQIFVSQDPNDYGLAHMMMAQRHFNLTGLLERLDSSTMLASVEGRTPFADVQVSELADQLPMNYHFAMSECGKSAVSKQLLRRAFKNRVPKHVLDRPKASFPLPFQNWMAEQSQVMLNSALAKDVFHPNAIGIFNDQTSKQWALSWPILNICLWLESMWGAQAIRKAA